MKQTFFLFVLFVLASLIVLGGCTSTPPQVETPKVQVQVERPVVSLAWDTKDERKPWTAFMMKAIDTHWDKLQTAKDVNVFCPKYASLTEDQKKEVWGEIFVGMSYFESAWKPGAKYFETTMGYYSEGLFQLSVIDEKWAKCGLNEKSILEAETNIQCAVKIMARQISKFSEIVLSKSVYWSVIRKDPTRTKVPKIKTMVLKNAPMCEK